MADSSQHTPRSGISAPSDIRSRVSELNDHIRTLDQSLAAAHCERNDLQSRLDDYKYPILTLPVEVTSEIFINFLPIYPLAPPIVRILSLALLGQICSKWRTVAFNTPWLRRAIEIEVDTRIQALFSAQLNVLDTWLTRSKNCPLSLSVRPVRHKHSGLSYLFYSPYDLRRLVDTICSHSQRWEYVRVLIPFSDLH
jgi:hypothetical protein